MTTNNFYNDHVTLSSVIKEMEMDNLITYSNFFQSYKANRIPESITKYLICKKKLSNTGYYIANENVKAFKEAILKEFS